MGLFFFIILVVFVRVSCRKLIYFLKFILFDLYSDDNFSNILFSFVFLYLICL